MVPADLRDEEDGPDDDDCPDHLRRGPLEQEPRTVQATNTAPPGAVEQDLEPREELLLLHGSGGVQPLRAARGVVRG